MVEEHKLLFTLGYVLVCLLFNVALSVWFGRDDDLSLPEQRCKGFLRISSLFWPLVLGVTGVVGITVVVCRMSDYLGEKIRKLAGGRIRNGNS